MKLGQRVRWLHRSECGEVACDVGTVTNLFLQFAGTPLEKTRVTVRFDAKVFKHKLRPWIPDTHEITAAPEDFEPIKNNEVSG
jgi:uncharacterized Fe-S cluster protein YjdI